MLLVLSTLLQVDLFFLQSYENVDLCCEVVLFTPTTLFSSLGQAEWKKKRQVIIMTTQTNVGLAQ